MRRFLAWGAVAFLVVARGAVTATATTADRIDELLKDLAGEDAARREAAIVALGEAGPAAAPRIASVVTSTDDDDVLLDALDALSRSSMAYAYGYLFWDALPPEAEEEPETRARVWDALVRVGDAFIGFGEVGAASDHFCDLLDMAETTRERCTAIRGLGRASRRRAAATVFAVLADDDPEVVAAALDAIVDLRWPQAVPHLRTTMKSARPELRVGLLDALARRDDEEAAAFAKGYLENEDDAVSAAAGRAVAKHAGFITDWWLLGPLPDDATLDASAARPSEDAAVEVGGRRLTWRPFRTADPRGEIDPAKTISVKSGDGAWALAELPDAKVERKATLLVRNDGPLELFLDGTPVATIDEARAIEGDGEPHPVELALTPGPHRLLLRVRRGGGSVAYSVRLEGH